MRTTFLVTFLLLCISIQLLAQHNPLVGTWQVVSIKATDSDGKKMSLDGSQFKETKIITPTHYVLITHMKQGETMVFDKAMAGTVRVEGNMYIETPEYVSDPVLALEKTNFTYKLEGDKFIQSGTFTTADGKTGTIEELVFQKVKTGKANPNSPFIGSWKLISAANQTDASGFEVDTPTHWLGVYFKGKTFDAARGGTFIIQPGNKAKYTTEFYSNPDEKGDVADVSYQFNGDKVTYSGDVIGKDGKKKQSFSEVYQRVGTKAKTALAKQLNP
jgi:hypothetical protein